MDENMNVEVSTEVSGAEEATREFEYDETASGPSKGFVTVIVGLGAAAIAGVVALGVRHKKKKKAKKAEVEVVDVDDDDFEDFEEKDANEEHEQEEKSEEKSAKKK